MCGPHPCVFQSKKRQYDQEVENLERQQKQTIERLEQEHTTRLRDEAKRIKGDQDKELSKYQNMLKNRKKEVSTFDVRSLPWALTQTGGRACIHVLFIVSYFDMLTHTKASLICLVSVCVTAV